MFPTFGLDKLAAQIIAAVVCVGLVVGGYYWWKHTVKAEALAEWNQKQVEIVQKEQQKLIQNLTVINENQIRIIDQLEAQNKILDQKFKDLSEYLDSSETTKKYKGTSSSDVLKRTFKELNR